MSVARRILSILFPAARTVSGTYSVKSLGEFSCHLPSIGLSEDIEGNFLEGDKRFRCYYNNRFSGVFHKPK